MALVLAGTSRVLSSPVMSERALAAIEAAKRRTEAVEKRRLRPKVIRVRMVLYGVGSIIYVILFVSLWV